MEDKGDSSKVSMIDDGPNKDGFIPIKPRDKGRGKKQPYKDRQSEEGFNHFEVLDNLNLEEGIPIKVSSRATTMGIGKVLEQVIVDKDMPMVHVQGDVGNYGKSIGLQDDTILVDLTEVLTSAKERWSSQALGVH